MTAELSDAARELLLEASRDPAGLILTLTGKRGSAFLKTNRKIFGDGTPGEQARWESGLRQLVGLGLVEPQGVTRQVFGITDEGYQTADILSGRK
jgi:hypothetical protein